MTYKNKLLIIGCILGSLFVGYFAAKGYIKHEAKRATKEGLTGTDQNLQGSFRKTEESPDPSDSRKIPELPEKNLPIIINLIIKSYHKADFMAGDAEDRIDFIFEFRNELEKDLRSFSGLVVFKDLFERKILSLDLTYDSPLASGQTGIWRGSIHYDESLDVHRRLISINIKDLSTDFIAKKVIYSDGTKEIL